ncbi:MAG: Spi family protease inhibitor [Muribaculaceae bacterium]|nr:Spi family protease inhibitor [Muribaculaceae bacterium]
MSQKQASKIAEVFFNAMYEQVTTTPKMVWNGRQLTTDRLFAPFYVYNHPKGGYVVISADTKAYPVLAYSRTGKFDRNKLGDDEKDIMTKYAHEIELVRYDSRQPEMAMQAWRNMPLYINRVLNNPYNTPEFERLNPESKDAIEAMDRRNAAVFMPAAIEFDYPVSELFRSVTLDDVTGTESVDEDVPFRFYEDCIAELHQEEMTRQAMLDEIISPTKPVVILQGGGHLSVKYPEQIKMVTIYSLQGPKMMERYFRNTDTVNLDLSALPVGFYALMAVSDQGKVYGMKIYR